MTDVLTQTSGTPKVHREVSHLFRQIITKVDIDKNIHYIWVF